MILKSYDNILITNKTKLKSLQENFDFINNNKDNVSNSKFIGVSLCYYVILYQNEKMKLMNSNTEIQNNIISKKTSKYIKENSIK